MHPEAQERASLARGTYRTFIEAIVFDVTTTSTILEARF